MKQQKIKKIFGDQLNELSDLCEKISPDFDKEVIHDFRVAIKSFRSFLRLLSMSYGIDRHLELSKEIKRLYHIAGTIRDVQQELEKLTADRLNAPVYLGNQHSMIARQKNEWQKQNAKKIFHEYKIGLEELKHDPLPKVALQQFNDFKIAIARELCLIKPLNNNQIHEIRKLVKDVLYVNKFARKNWKPAHKQTQAIATEKLELVSDAIGGYNDSRVMLERISAFDSKAMTPHEKNALKIFLDEHTKALRKEKKKTLATVRKAIGTGKPTHIN